MRLKKKLIASFACLMMVLSCMSFVACTPKECTVTFDYFISGREDIQITIPYNTTIPADKIPELLTDPNSDPLGWGLSKELDNLELFDFSTLITKNITLYFKRT